MYSVRKYTIQHGNTNLIILLCILVVTTILVWQLGINYLIIFCSSSLIHIIIETGLVLKGIRKGKEYMLLGHKLPRWADLLMRSLVEGPGFCVPAFFVADRLMDGDIGLGIAGPVLLVGAFSLFMGLSDRNQLRRLNPGEEPMVTRRAMTKPLAVMLLALINTGCLTALFLMPAPYRAHAFTYLIAYSTLVMLFYFINYNLGVRMIEIYDHKHEEYIKPGPIYQAAGLTYDSAYEMALLISPAYWATFYLGLFHFNG
jgi:hypothetical protein